MNKIPILLFLLFTAMAAHSQSNRPMVKEILSSPLTDEEHKPFFLIVELRGRDLPDSLMTFYFWEHFVSSNFQSLPAQIDTLNAETGTMFSGNIGAKIFQYTSIPIAKPALFNIFYGSGYLIKDFYAFPGDTVKLLVDRDNARSYFIGKNALTYQIQQDLDREIQKSIRLKTPTMMGADLKTITKEERNRRLYEDAVRNQIPGVNQLMKFLPTQKEKQQHLIEIRKSLVNKPLPGSEVLKAYQSQIPKEQYELFHAEQIGKTYKSDLKLLNRNLSDLGEDLHVFLEEIQDLGHDYAQAEYIGQAYCYQDFLTEKASILHRSGRLPLFQSFDNYPRELKEILMTRFIGQNFKSLADPNDYLAKAKQEASLTWTNQILDQLIQSRAIGAEFREISLPDAQGNIVSPKEWKGKVVLIDFWFTGCKACIDYFEKCIKPAETHFRNHPNVHFVTINADRNTITWKKSLESGRYTSEHATNLFAGLDQGQDLLNFYNINSYPSQLLLDTELRIFRSGHFARNPEALISMINEALGENQDHNQP